MSNLHIGLSGMRVAQQALDLIGTNISNAATEGYHRQDARIAPVYYGGGGFSGVGGGAEVIEVRRNMDVLIEEELVRQNPLYKQLEQELTTLEGIEAALGDLESEGLTKGMSDFFAAMDELSANPESQAYQEQLLWSANALTGYFRNLANFMNDLKDNIVLEAEALAKQVNALSAEVADLNAQIHSIKSRGGNTNTLMDRRDQAVIELSELIEVNTSGRISGDGILNVSAAGMPLVSGHTDFEVSTGVTANDELGVTLSNAAYYITDVGGGRIGALMNLRNEVIPDLESRLDNLSKYLVREINRVHVQGVGTHGSFEELTGWSVSAEAFSEWKDNITDGEIRVRVIDESDGSVSRSTISMTTADDVTDLAAALDGIANLNASIVAGSLHIETDSGFQFDFLPALDPKPLTSTLGVDVSVSGSYADSENQVFEMTVAGAPGPQVIGSAANLQLEVRNGAGELVKSLNIGNGYAPGDRLEIYDGMYVSLEAGSVTAGEQFQVEALATTDTTGLLAACGINVLFQGDMARSMYVVNEVMSDSSRIATAIGQGMSDNLNAKRMADLQDENVDELDGNSLKNYHSQIISNVGDHVAQRDARKTSVEAVIKQILNHREEVSGVDINEEGAKLYMYENMFSSIAKFMSVQNDVLETLMSVI